MSSMPETPFTIERADGYLAHRRPFLFVDHGEISADGTKARASHTFTADEPYFAGHFPGDPIVPGVILLELIAQTANLLLSHRAGRMIQGYLVGVEDAKFNTPVRPDRTVTAQVQYTRELTAGGETQAGRIVAFKGTAYLEQRRCMRATVHIYQPG